MQEAPLWYLLFNMYTIVVLPIEINNKGIELARNNLANPQVDFIGAR